MAARTLPPLLRLPALAAALLAAACGGAPDEPTSPAEEVPAERLVHGIAEELRERARPPEPDGPGAPRRLAGRFEDEAAARGLDYVNRSGEPEKPVILEANGAGVAVLDLGGDGDLDLVFAQGLGSLAALVEGPGADLEPFANDGQGRFARLPGPGLSGWWTGLAAGDVDGDGTTDLVAGAFGDLALLEQTPEGGLRAVADAGLMPDPAAVPGARFVPGVPAPPPAGAGEPPGSTGAPWWATSLALFDADLDGALDLYVGQYLELDPHHPPGASLGDGPLALPCTWKGLEVFCGPRGLVPQPDRLLLGRGDGTFEDVTAARLPDHVAGFSLAVGAFDADGDGDTDLYVANDSVPNLMLVNDGRGTLRDFGLQAGVAVNQDGEPQAGMGVAFGDVDRDGVLDLAVTNFSEEPTELYLGAEVGFRPRTHRVGLGTSTRRMLSWGVHLLDFDGDGRLELYTANGHVYPQADGPYTGTSYAQRDGLWRLPGDGPVEPVEVAGERSLTALVTSSRASAAADLDGDLAPDLVVTTVDGPALFFVNRLEAPEGGGHRLAVRCLGPEEPAAEAPRTPRTPRDGRGARVIVVPEPSGDPGDAGSEPPFALLSEAQTAGSYQASGTPWLHFGLGRAERYAELRVRWPSGRVEVLPGGPADRRLWLREGEGVVREEAP